MNFKTLLLTAAAAAVLSTAGAGMADARPGHFHGWPIGHHMGPHNHYWRHGYHGFLALDRVFFELRRHHYDRFIGDPYWVDDRYVVRSYDRFGNPVLVEVDPYTGEVIGEVPF
ncbi:MAG: hypothetical protein ABSD21_07740 [Rhizomicrobium sp.]|jgi:hypothetical protein